MDALKNAVAYYGPRSNPIAVVSRWINSTWQVVMYRDGHPHTYVSHVLGCVLAKADAWDRRERVRRYGVGALEPLDVARLTDSQRKCLAGDP